MRANRTQRLLRKWWLLRFDTMTAGGDSRSLRFKAENPQPCWENSAKPAVFFLNGSWSQVNGKHQDGGHLEWNDGKGAYQCPFPSMISNTRNACHDVVKGVCVPTKCTRGCKQINTNYRDYICACTCQMGNAGTHPNQFALSTFVAPKKEQWVTEARVRQFVRQQQGVELDWGHVRGDLGIGCCHIGSGIPVMKWSQITWWNPISLDFLFQQKRLLLFLFLLLLLLLFRQPLRS